MASYTGGDGENPVTSDVEAAGDPFAAQHFNLSRAKKIALSAISTESLFRRPDSWLKASAPLFDASLATPGSHPHVTVTLTEMEGLSIEAVMGFATSNIEAGGDFGIVPSSVGFDHGTPGAAHVNTLCVEHFLYSYSAQDLDGDPGYESSIDFGSWTATAPTCSVSEDGHMTLYFAVR